MYKDCVAAPAIRIAGGALFGGPLGAAFAAAGARVCCRLQTSAHDAVPARLPCRRTSRVERAGALLLLLCLSPLGLTYFRALTASVFVASSRVYFLGSVALGVELLSGWATAPPQPRRSAVANNRFFGG